MHKNNEYWFVIQRQNNLCKKEKTDYLVYHLNKVYNALPQFIKTVFDRLFNHSDIQLKFFKQQFEPEVKEKERRSWYQKHSWSARLPDRENNGRPWRQTYRRW